MAFTTQRNLLQLNPKELYEKQRIQEGYDGIIKRYLSCLDGRAWSLDPAKRSRYLKDIVAYRQEKCVPPCVCDQNVDQVYQGKETEGSHRQLYTRDKCGFGNLDCVERRDHIRHLIKTKGEETVSEMKKLLKNYQKRVEYYTEQCRKKIHQEKCKQRKALPQKSSRSRKPKLQFSDAQLKGNKVHRRIVRKPTGFIHNNVSKVRSELSQLGSSVSSIPDRAKKAMETAIRESGVPDIIDSYSQKIEDAVRKLNKIVVEFKHFKDNVKDIVRAKEASTSKTRAGTSKRGCR